MIGPILATDVYRSRDVFSATSVYLTMGKSLIKVIRSGAGPGWVGRGSFFAALATRGHDWASGGLRGLTESQWRSVSPFSAAVGAGWAGCSVEVDAASSADSA